MKLKSAFCKELEDSRPVQVLNKALAENRLAHGILLQGQCLETLEAVALSLCSTLLGSEDPKSNPDFFELRPANKMRQISVDNTRELIRKIQHTANLGGYKVALIHQPERMHVSAANAFLKTLEEPPAGTILFLLSTKPYKVLETIRSRCLNFKLPAHLGKLEDRDWQQWLEDYQEWVAAARAGIQTKSDSTRLIMHLYSLIFSFSETLKSLSAEVWQAKKIDLPENLSDEALTALETGTLKELRERMMAEIEEATHEVALENPKEAPPVSQLALVTEELEKVVGLMEVNLNEGTALEAFMLESLKIWAA